MRPVNRRRPHHRSGREHAVVIGAGIAGLLCARVLSDVFAHVTIIERDRLAPEPRPRKGVPQGRHAHALQARGLQAFEQLLPGTRDALTAAGAPLADFCRAGRLRLPYGSPPPLDSGIHIQMVSRPLLETIIRAQVLRIAGVYIREGWTVTGLTLSDDRRRTTGVRLHQRPQADRSTGTETLPADLVADTSGRGSHLPEWLLDLGLPQVAESIVDARVGYASRTYRAAPATPADWLALFELPQAPYVSRGAFALRTEGDRLLVSLQGAGGDHPPGDEPGFDAFAKSLSSGLYDIMRASEPLTPVVRYARTANQRRHYHGFPSWPDGLIVLGDAACAFNPVYAQGMTVAALEAVALRDLLTDRAAEPLDGLSTGFQQRVAHITRWPWLIATLPDRAWQDTRAPLPVRLGLWYLDQWHKNIPTEPDMFQDIARVTNMTSSPILLFHPRNLTRIATAAVAHRKRSPES
ncbi:FAD-dependent oxidoreductase [Streptomyces sp. NPDC127084]|uniref:FAD-dependent oxidoreductase n=1 Tax=Streptomyces sp. NPDC127084 TaxID=3347133 RepID=UPI00364BE817